MWNHKHSLLVSLLYFGILNILSIEEFYVPGTPILWVGLMCLGAMNPYLSLLTLIASQVLANPAGAFLTSTQLFILVWFGINAPFVARTIARRVVFPAPVVFWCIAVPVALVRGETGHLNELFSVFLTCWITYLCYREMESPVGVVESIVLGSVIGAMPFPLHALGVNYFRDARQSLIAGAERGGIARFSAGLGDFNYIGACILVGFAAALALILYNQLSKSRVLTRFQAGLLVFFAGLSCFSIFGTLSRASIAGILVTLFVVLVLLGRAKFSLTYLPKALFFLGIGLVALYFTFHDFFEKYLTAIVAFQTLENTYTEINRANVARIHLLSLMNHPLLGAKVYFYDVEFAAHNTFIQMGTNFGVFGALAFLYYSVGKPFNDIKNIAKKGNIALYAAYIMCLYSMLSLSLTGWKIFWIIWTIIMASHGVSSRANGMPAIRAGQV